MATENQVLACILQEMQKLNAAMGFGNNFFRISPYRLGANDAGVNAAVKILEREPNNRVRKVTIWVDSAAGGPTPTLRIGTSDVGTGGNQGGVRVDAGKANPIGEVPGKTELWAAANCNINIYVVECG